MAEAHEFSDHGRSVGGARPAAAESPAAALRVDELAPARAMSAPARAARPKRAMLLLALLFFTPLLLAFVIYYGSGWRPTGRTNHCVLIEPARSLPPVALPQIAPLQPASPGADAAASGGDALAAANVLTGKWSLVY